MSREEALDVLGLQSNATLQDIKKAYKILAQQHHPDRGGSQKEFERLTTAYELLKNAKTVVVPRLTHASVFSIVRKL
ncbi:Chaperone protein DnaJ [compost metagenome]